MTCQETLRNLTDREDGLLSPEVAADLDEHLAECPPCAGQARDLRALRALIYEAEAVDPPRGLGDRIVATAAARETFRIPAPLSYAAAFLAGVVLTLALTARSEPTPFADGEATPAVTTAPPPEPEPFELSARIRVPRRIR